MNRIIVVASFLFIAVISLSKSTCASDITTTICAKADSASEDVSHVSPTNFTALVTAAGRAAKLASDCAIGHAQKRETLVALAYMAMSFHNGNVVAMGMHLEGDDANALRMIRTLQAN